jgi:hypothetical protein
MSTESPNSFITIKTSPEPPLPDTPSPPTFRLTRYSRPKTTIHRNDTLDRESNKNELIVAIKQELKEWKKLYITAKKELEKSTDIQKEHQLLKEQAIKLKSQADDYFHKYLSESSTVRNLEHLKTENEYLKIHLENIKKEMQVTKETWYANRPIQKRSPHKCQLIRDNEKMTEELSFVNYENESLSNDVDNMSAKIKNLELKVNFLQNEIILKDKLIAKDDTMSKYLDQEKIILGIVDELEHKNIQYDELLKQYVLIQSEHKSLQLEFTESMDEHHLSDRDHMFHQELLEAMIDTHRSEIKELKEKYNNLIS